MRHALALIPVLLLAAGCETSDSIRPTEEEMIASRSVRAPGFELVWEVVRKEIESSGFMFDVLKTSEEQGVFETQWVETLAPFRFKGKRKKILGTVREEPDRPGRFRVNLTTWTQRNADIKDPMDSGRAIWQDEAPDDSTSRLVLYRIEQHLPDYPDGTR